MRTKTRDHHLQDDEGIPRSSSAPVSFSQKMPSTTTTTTIGTRVHKLPGDSNHVFVEYVRQPIEGDGDASSSTSTSTIQALAIRIDPQECSRIVKALSQCLPLPRQLQHLKRVKRYHPSPQQPQSPPTKRSKVENENNTSPQLHLLLGLAPLSTLLEAFHLDDARGEAGSGHSSLVEAGSKMSSMEHLLAILYQGKREEDSSSILTTTTTTTTATAPDLKDFALQALQFHHVDVPRRPPQSQDEACEANQLWPTHFFPLQSLEHKQHQGSLTVQEMNVMIERIQGLLSTRTNEAWVVDSSSNLVVATSGEEETAQEGGISSWLGRKSKNPLATPILFAIQGVSRLERQQQQSSSQRHQHYLCSGYDLYCNYEPCVFESMALVHSRFGRVIWCTLTPPPPGNVWQHGLSKHTIHCLPGTNHHFRAFEYKGGLASK